MSLSGCWWITSGAWVGREGISVLLKTMNVLSNTAGLAQEDIEKSVI